MNLNNWWLKSWPDKQKAIYKRDDESCVVCGRHPHMFSVHHIIRRGKALPVRLTDHPNNLVTACNIVWGSESCHKKFDQYRVPWKWDSHDWLLKWRDYRYEITRVMLKLGYNIEEIEEIWDGN